MINAVAWCDRYHARRVLEFENPYMTVQEMAEQVTVDKATVAENAAKVAEDRTAAETAAQTAQAVADSLPDDYVTAVGKDSREYS